MKLKLIAACVFSGAALALTSCSDVPAQKTQAQATPVKQSIPDYSKMPPPNHPLAGMRGPR